MDKFDEAAAEVLQWSHDLSAMDTSSAGGRPAPPGLGFNGAMTFQPWIRPGQRLRRPPCAVLQWSHDLSAMDTVWQRPKSQAKKSASMEP